MRIDAYPLISSVTWLFILWLWRSKIEFLHKYKLYCSRDENRTRYPYTVVGYLSWR